MSAAPPWMRGVAPWMAEGMRWGAQEEELVVGGAHHQGDNNRQDGLESRRTGEEEGSSLSRLNLLFRLTLFTPHLQGAMRGSVIQGSSGEVESRGSVIQSSTLQRQTHIVPRSSHQQQQQAVMATSQPGAVFASSHQSSSNNLPASHSQPASQGPVRLGRDGMDRLRPSLAGSRQLVELLQPSRGGRASQRPMKNVNLRQKNAGTASSHQLKQEAGVGHSSSDQAQHPLMRGAVSSLPLVPPPPPGSLPQPTFTIGTSSALVPEDSKLSSAEQKRRGTIKNGFEFLRALVPSLSQTPNVKISKAALLTKVFPGKLSVLSLFT